MGFLSLSFFSLVTISMKFIKQGDLGKWANVFSCIRGRKEKLRERRKAGVERVYGRAARVQQSGSWGSRGFLPMGLRETRRNSAQKPEQPGNYWCVVHSSTPVQCGAFASGSRAWWWSLTCKWRLRLGEAHTHASTLTGFPLSKPEGLLPSSLKLQIPEVAAVHKQTRGTSCHVETATVIVSFQKLSVPIQICLKESTRKLWI